MLGCFRLSKIRVPKYFGPYDSHPLFNYCRGLLVLTDTYQKIPAGFIAPRGFFVPLFLNFLSADKHRLRNKIGIQQHDIRGVSFR